MEQRPSVPQIKISEVMTLLKQGYTRFAEDNIGFGSLQEHYSLSQADIRRIFQHEKLKGLKTIAPTFELIDDVTDEEPEVQGPTDLGNMLRWIAGEEATQNVHFQVKEYPLTPEECESTPPKVFE